MNKRVSFLGWMIGCIVFSAYAGPSVVLRIADEPETLDWTLAHTPVESPILTQLMDGLVGIDSSGEIVPMLAEKWSVSLDGRTYTFHLRSGVEWSDGKPLKAQDFVEGWKRLLSPVTASSYAYLLSDIQGADAYRQGTLSDFSQVGVKALGDSILEVRLNQSLFYWIEVTAFWPTFPIRQELIQQYGNEWTLPGRLVSLGPFALLSHTMNSEIVLNANPRYWNKKRQGNLEKVIFRLIPEDVQAFQQYQNGTLDYLSDFNGSLLSKFSIPDSEVRSGAILKTAYLGFAVGSHFLTQLQFRKIIAQAIDKKKLAHLIGNAQEATTLVPSSLLGYSSHIGLKFNPKAAKKEFNRFMGALEGEVLRMNYLLPDWTKSKVIAEFIKSELKNHLGINVQLDSVPNPEYRLKLDLKQSPLFDGNWTADFSDPDNFLSIFLSYSGNNRTNWKNKDFDRGVLEARQIKDLKKRKKQYFDLQKLLLETEAVIVPLYYEKNIFLLKPRVRNFKMNRMNFLDLRECIVSQH